MKIELKTKHLESILTQNAKPGNISRLGIVLLIGLLPAIALQSCGSANNLQTEAAKPGVAAKSAAISGDTAPAAAPNAVNQANSPSAPAKIERSLPQLIKKADLSLIVKSIDDSIKEVSIIIQQQQGDILGFQDSKPQDSTIRHTVSMQLRVPQDKLETTLDSLIKLGTIENRSLSAEDVSDQLVDNDARLRNLRKAEEWTLKIMERSGSIGDVLKASQELIRIRESIERLDAQQKSLKNQVAYSSINLTLSAAISASPTAAPSLGLRLQESWGKATHAVTEITYSFLELSIWLFVFSPFLLLLGGAYFVYKRSKKQQSLPPAEDTELPSS